jgi:hypothetical protein
MSWSGWLTGKGGSQSNSKTERSGGVTKTHFLSTAGKGGSKSNHSHTIVRESGGRKTAHCVPHKGNRK